MLNEHGQPVDTRWNAARRADRTIHEMLGLVKGVIADGHVSAEEATFLAQWIDCNPEAVNTWPGDVLANRLERIFADGRVDDEEREELKFFLQNVVGETSFVEDENPSTRLPFDTPPPALVFDGQTYVLTGRFLFGTRARCEGVVCERGGICESGITRRTTVLVIGELGSRDWIHTSFGRKIQNVSSNCMK